ncbi:MAG: DUF2845 domain-containing protein [Woeseiaceae bacterium]
MARYLLIAIFAVVFGASDAGAASFRCGGSIIRTGMTMDEVRSACGSPSSSEIEEHDVRSGNRVVGTTQMHIWRYNRSSGQSTAVLHFDNGKVTSITMESK